MRYWEACEAQVSADEAIEECRVHDVQAEIRETDGALIDAATGDVIAFADDYSEYFGAAILGYLGY
ncbi:hypothetical protein ATY81_23300 [Rhizobium sp. R72]|nr:hypothetical protein ATY81_23300 [Rhizobium sp. R72]OWW01984.1 hypothetical protein ATY80_23300 [Rhizobium sp. R711]